MLKVGQRVEVSVHDQYLAPGIVVRVPDPNAETRKLKLTAEIQTVLKRVTVVPDFHTIRTEFDSITQAAYEPHWKNIEASLQGGLQ